MNKITERKLSQNIIRQNQTQNTKNEDKSHPTENFLFKHKRPPIEGLHAISRALVQPKLPIGWSLISAFIHCFICLKLTE